MSPFCSLGPAWQLRSGTPLSADSQDREAKSTFRWYRVGPEISTLSGVLAEGCLASETYFQAQAGHSPRRKHHGTPWTCLSALS